ncbi:SDR family oxidoreductase [Kamptonema formosum]|uniref:SDR family oxidoreductase n=1 Tax=Kamptonema formosum TaxID=331992 RepID=UPI000347648F|nr:SDR family oxidoreductase [Oscillatoria sp. PCC 10802]
MNVAIIGCGYVGTAVARHWRNLGCFVTATTTSDRRVAELEEVAQRVVVTKADSEASLLSAIQNQEAVLLSVAPAGDKQVDAEGYEKTYLGTAENLVAALKHSPAVKQLIYTSSCAVCGNRNGEWVSEESPLSPANRQAEILRDTEQVLLGAAGESLQVCILRLGGIYGPGREIRKRFNVCGKTLPGSGDNFTNWIHLDDIAGAVEFALANRLQGIYNLVNDEPVLARELADRVCVRYGFAKIQWEPAEHNSRSYSLRVSNQKLKAAGYRFTHSETLV